ncbi:MAG: Polyhydroxyalkanoate synthase, partial [Modestobacter sp.]|nr:Polyhydroxyalkanoate synthase [Modestobacter sp.]
MTITTTTPAQGSSDGRQRAPERPVPRSESEALASVEGAEPIGIPSPRGIVGGLLSPFVRPRPVAREAARLARDAVRIVRGTDEIAPSPKDKRFADAAWSAHPGYRRLAQAYLAWTGSLTRLVDEYDSDGADWRQVEQARFFLNAFTSALSPTNTLLGNPAALKRAFDTGGRSVARGLGHMLEDLVHNGGMPAQVDRRAFSVGKDLGVTPGAVVHRNEVIEVIQYAPTTASVRQRPLVIVPPPIVRFYFLDLRPGRSFVEYAVSQGLQVFMISWRNPTKAQAAWDLDTYAGAIVDAIDVAREVTGSPDVTTLGFCAGGQLMTTVLNHLAATGDDRVHAAGYAVT